MSDKQPGDISEKPNQPRDMRAHNAWGLFSMQIVQGGFAVLVHDVPIVGPVSYGAAIELFHRLIKQTVALDGNAKALAIAWGNAALESENARFVQARCTELIQESRACKAKLKIAQALLYRVKFSLAQGTAQDEHEELTAAIIDTLDTTSIAPSARVQCAKHQVHTDGCEGCDDEVSAGLNRTP